MSAKATTKSATKTVDATQLIAKELARKAREDKKAAKQLQLEA